MVAAAQGQRRSVRVAVDVLGGFTASVDATDAHGSVYVVRGAEVTPAVVADAAAHFAAEGALLTDLRVGTRTLQDVFLDLTSETAEPKEEVLV